MAEEPPAALSVWTCDFVYEFVSMWACGCQHAPSYVCVSERASVHVWDVTQARAAQHSSLFKGPFILLQLVQLLRTDKQDLELWAAKHRPPTPSLKPLWPSPAPHCDSEMDKQMPTNRHTTTCEGKFCPEKMKDGCKLIKSRVFPCFLFFNWLWRNWPSGMFVLNLYQILLPISQ